jgi:hypothetical protein
MSCGVGVGVEAEQLLVQRVGCSSWTPHARLGFPSLDGHNHGMLGRDIASRIYPQAGWSCTRGFPGRSSLRLWMAEPLIRSTNGRPRFGPTSANASIAYETYLKERAAEQEPPP